MAYRPINPVVFWRSAALPNRTAHDTNLHAYVLTSRFTNAIGFYELNARVAAAELKLSLRQFEATAQRLEDQQLSMWRSGFVLSLDWFFHNSWGATLRGKVRSLALKELAKVPENLLSEWIAASVKAGVPAGEAEGAVQEALRWPSAALPQGHLHNNKEQEPQTSTTPGVGCGSTEVFLELLPVAERYRVLLLHATKDLSADAAQGIADELSQRLADATTGRGVAITDVRAWLQKLASSAARGEMVLARGIGLAQERIERAQKAQQAATEAIKQAQQQEDSQRQSDTCQLRLTQATDEDLSRIAELAVQSSLVTHRNRDSVVALVMSRQLGTGLERAAIMRAIKPVNAQDGTTP